MSVQRYREKLEEHYRKRKVELMRAEKRSLKTPQVSRDSEQEMSFLKGQMSGILLAIGECFVLVENQQFPGVDALSSKGK